MIEAFYNPLLGGARWLWTKFSISALLLGVGEHFAKRCEIVATILSTIIVASLRSVGYLSFRKQ